MKIALTGGGSVGHVYPIAAIIPILKESGAKLIYIGEKGKIEESVAKREDIDFFALSAPKLKRELSLSNLTIPFRLFSSVIAAKKILQREKPSVLFCKGGYVCLPSAIAAKSLKIPVILHESDLSIGLANKISSSFAAKVFLSFNVKRENSKYVYSGPLIRRKVINAPKRFFKPFNSVLPTLLVLGGSLGAQGINALIFDNIENLCKSFNVLHVTGKGNPLLKNTPKNHLAVDSVSDIGGFYSSCDVCISRGGANSLFELMLNSVPTLVIPLPKNASRGDQIENAAYFEKSGAVKVLNENSIFDLTEEVKDLYDKRFTFKQAMANLDLSLGNNVVTNELVRVASGNNVFKRKYPDV